nr:hypothetical protein [Deinococcus yavapaiensis]
MVLVPLVEQVTGNPEGCQTKPFKLETALNVVVTVNPGKELAESEDKLVSLDSLAHTVLVPDVGFLTRTTNAFEAPSQANTTNRLRLTASKRDCCIAERTLSANKSGRGRLTFVAIMAAKTPTTEMTRSSSKSVKPWRFKGASIQNGEFTPSSV